MNFLQSFSGWQLISILHNRRSKQNNTDWGHNEGVQVSHGDLSPETYKYIDTSTSYKGGGAGGEGGDDGGLNGTSP